MKLKIEKAVEAIECFATQGITAAMNQVNNQEFSLWEMGGITYFSSPDLSSPLMMTEARGNPIDILMTTEYMG